MPRPRVRRAPTAPKTVSITNARASWDDVMRRVERGESVHITRRGVPIVVVRPLRPDERR